MQAMNYATRNQERKRFAENPPVMGVYGTFRQGEIQDFGPERGVLAHVLNVDGSTTSLGFFADRKAAMGAVAEVTEARKRLAEPAPPFRSGLPT
jgi:hypothetical protein